MDSNFRNVCTLGVNMIIDMHNEGMKAEEIVDMIMENLPKETQDEYLDVMDSAIDEDAEQEGTEA